MPKSLNQVLSRARLATSFFLLVQLALIALVLRRFLLMVDTGKLMSRVTLGAGLVACLELLYFPLGALAKGCKGHWASRIVLKFLVQDFPQQPGS